MGCIVEGIHIVLGVKPLEASWRGVGQIMGNVREAKYNLEEDIRDGKDPAKMRNTLKVKQMASTVMSTMTVVETGAEMGQWAFFVGGIIGVLNSYPEASNWLQLAGVSMAVRVGTHTILMLMKKGFCDDFDKNSKNWLG